MAKGNPFLGNVSGSFGDITLSTYRGKTVIKRKTAPRNPRTPKQIYQRMFFATISKSRTALKPIIDHSFEQIPHGVDSLNYFTKRNIALMREGTVFDYAKQTWVNPNMNFVAPKATSFPANPLRISEGSLIALQPAQIPQQNLPEWGFDDDNSFKHIVPLFGSIDKYTITMEELIGQVCKANDIEYGDFLTLVLFTSQIDAIAPFSCSMKFVRFKLCKCLLTTSDEDSGETYTEEIHSLIPSNINGVNYEIPDVIYNDAGVMLVQNENKTDTKNYGKWTPYIDLSDPDCFEMGVDFGKGEILIHGGGLIPTDHQLIACAWIHSRPNQEDILTSTQDMILSDPSGERIPFNLDMQTAFDLWTKQAKAIGEPKFLLEGGDV